jgi:hypothetical protein
MSVVCDASGNFGLLLYLEIKIREYFPEKHYYNTLLDILPVSLTGAVIGIA